MKVDLFDFTLPEERIALRPAVPREAGRLLHVPREGDFADRLVGDLPGLLRPDDLLVFNDTRVIPARLFGLRRRDPSPRGEGVARVEVMLHLRADASSWQAFLRPAKRVREGDRVEFTVADATAPLIATVEAKGEGGDALLRFDLAGADLDAAIATHGTLPLPPYIASKRPDDRQDRIDYQTVYARHDGAVAAPTAGLHFTPTLLAELAERGIASEHVTLHVGAGTFLPVKADDTADHRMHAEIGVLDEAAAARVRDAKAAGRRIVAIGTTSLRLLESAATETGEIRPFSGPTSIFITPGYRFRVVDALWTNFHLPRSTLFMLVSAFSGLDRMRAAYAHAVAHGYRFYSYGDASLLERADPTS